MSNTIRNIVLFLSVKNPIKEGIIRTHLDMMRKALEIFVFITGICSTHAAFAVELTCPGVTAGIVKDRKLYRTLHSSNVQALKETKINTTFPSPNMTIVDQSKWLAPDAEFADQIRLRRRLYQHRPDRVFNVMPGQEALAHKAGKELLEKLAMELPKNYPDFYELQDRILINKKTGDKFNLETDEIHPLAKAGLLLQDDITINAKLPDGEFHLIGGFVATPTNWELKDFMGLPIHEVHSGVFGYNERLRKTVQGALEKMAPDKIIGRNNWFLYEDPGLALPPYHRTTHPYPRVTEKNVGSAINLRSELESIAMLPGSETILFTIRPRVWPISFVKENAPELLPNIAEGIFTHSREEYYNSQFAPALYKYLTGNPIPKDRLQKARNPPSP